MFIDREDAAIQLARALETYKNKETVVLGIPRGGAVTGYHVAIHLNAEFSLLISRKLGHPYNPEFAIGAITEDGTLHLNQLASLEVSQAQIDLAIEHQKKEIERRIKILRKGEPLPILKDKIVIIVDDGIATGATISAAIKMCKKRAPAKIVVAAPVSGSDVANKLKKEADEVVILETPSFLYAVSLAYESFSAVTDDEALRLFEKWRKLKTPPEKTSQ